MQFEVDIATGLIAPARQVESPNCDARPAGCEPELMVVHGISLPPGEFGGPWVDQLFCNELDPAGHPYFAEIQGLKVSSHLLVDRSGGLIQYVPFGARAWHAGQSCYFGRAGCNDFSVGIELEGTDDLPYTDPQYQALAGVAVALGRAYPGLRSMRMAGHRDIAPGRKTDPGQGFDWLKLDRLIAQASLADKGKRETA